MQAKRLKEVKAQINKKQVYGMDEAIALVKKSATAKFPESIELHVKLGIDPSKSDQLVRSTIALPHGTGKSKRVAAFVEAEKEAMAKEAGADLVGGDELIAKIAQSQAIDFDVAVATPAMMPKIAKLAKLLGPRGLMPNPKTETVGPNIDKIVKEQKAGKVAFKNDATGNLHVVFGSAKFTEAQLKENLVLLSEAIRKTKPASSKGIFIRNAVICSTMGPGVHVSLA
jgi:large subunit ribosomal protein L1